MSERVDILLATYQGANFLDELLESILTQTYPHLHVIIRDDGSTDQTGQVVQKWKETYPQSFSILPTTTRLGIIGNFSELMQNSLSPYIMFADQDDIWLPHKVEASLDEMKRIERQYGSHLPLAVHTDLKVVDRDLKELSSSFWKYVCLNPSQTALNRLLPQNVLTGCAMMMNRPLLELASPIPAEAVMHDWWVALVAACFGHIHYLEQPTILYRQHGGNDTGAKPYQLWYYLRHLNEAKNCAVRTYRQAEAFLARYHLMLTPCTQQILKSYCELDGLPYFKKLRQMVKYQFYKQGLLRNLKMLLQ